MNRTHRLYWRIWFAVLASLALFTVLAGLLWKAIGERPYRGTEHALAALVVAVLPPPGADVEAQRGALLHWQQRLNADLALFGEDSRRVAATADDFPTAVTIDTGDDPVDWVRTPRGTAFALQLPDGRVLLARREGGARSPFGLLSGLALIMLAVGVGAYPVARRLTRRLERLQQSVERLGRGDLRARVDASGGDEVAQLAGSFNHAAARIEELVQSHRSLLANASHELRSPLARVRLAVEMLDEAAPERRAALRREVEQGIGEIDVLVEEILLSARLQATADVDPRTEFVEVDLTALAAEECARADVPLDADTVMFDGDVRLLRRLLRNLIENAHRHGSAVDTHAVLVELKSAPSKVMLRVHDRGPGVPQAQRERIFEPFYRLPGASEAGGGVGLGLALVQAIAQRHRGRAVCLPRAGGGSTFEIVLPRAGAQED